MNRFIFYALLLSLNVHYSFGIFQVDPKLENKQFLNAFLANRESCTWKQHEQYNVFTQYDKEFYLSHKDDFIKKYRSFYAVAKTIKPKKIIELGTSAGSGADAYMSASNAQFLGIDIFSIRHYPDGTEWNPYKIANELFKERGFKNWRLLNINLRTLSALPEKADLVVVDAAHDFNNEYLDLKLALTADPRYIFVDDVDGEQCGRALKKFMKEDLKDRIEFAVKIDYIIGGVVIKLKEPKSTSRKESKKERKTVGGKKSQKNPKQKTRH